MLTLQTTLLHCLNDGTQLAWVIDMQRKQIWVWEHQDLPMIYAGADPLPTLVGIPSFTVNDVMAMTRQRTTP